MNRTLFAIVAAAIAATATTAWLTVTAFHRRRQNGSKRLALTLPVHSAWWREHAQREGELLYVAVGDSAAQGIGASTPHRGYVGTVAAHLRKTTGKSVRVVNLSVSGSRLRETLESQVPKLAGLTPDVITVSIGANDIATFDGVRFDRELRKLANALPPHAIVADLPSFFFGEAERRVRLANGIVHQVVGERGFALAPLYRATRRQGAARVALNQAAADFFHPNDRGYRVWASAFLPLIDRVFESLPTRV
ncbi:MAG: SGNH/GDSL hydrolase family protein [Homoserinimonas sp.]